MSGKRFHAIGIMSGTSLDGLDLAYCRFKKKKNDWDFEIKAAQTLNYNAEWKSKLKSAHQLTGEELMKLHADYGRWIGDRCQNFIKQNKIEKLDLIASHGHTVFHQSHNRFTFQLGDGNAIHAKTKIPVVFDFRSLDVQLGGQGAPLVPVGDRYLFSEYDVCLNLGGIANLSMEKNKERVAFDICFANMGLNFLAASRGLDFDRGGSIARKGKVNEGLLKSINKFYGSFREKRPSLAREHFEKGLVSLLWKKNLSVEDKARTFCESIALEITQVLPKESKINMLVTGGGAKNKFLIEVIASKLNERTTVTIPDPVTIDFKEALVFAFLGVLRWRGKKNVLKSVTKAKRNSSSGVIIG
jgi:anhydro-N-acetylmuramic acid kinase